MPYDERRQARGAFFRKLTYYVAGIAIGFVILGVVQNAKKRHMLAQKQQQTAEQMNAGKPPSSEFPPPPAPPADSAPQ